MPETDLIVITILYLVQVGVFLYGLRRGNDLVDSESSPLISVVIAARDEGENLRACLDSIASQTYPLDNFEVIIANDNSTDRTGEICTQFSSNHKNFFSFETSDNSTVRGKPNALAQAIAKARGEVILITDADCEVPTTWIEYVAKRYTPDVGLVGGITLQKATNAFGGMQSLDWAYILGVASASAGLRNPLGSIGNNLSFRKEAYEQVGGYSKLKFSVTEDYTLVQAILETKKWEYRYPIDARMLVESKPCPTLKSVIQQKHRWGKGGLDMKLYGFLIMLIAFSMHVALLWHFALLSLPSTAAILLIKFIADYVFLYQILARLKRTGDLRYFYWFELYYILYVIALPFLVFFGGKVRWKGRTY